MTRYNQMPERNSPAPFIPSKYQEHLTRLLGRNPYGQPKLRLVWGQEVKDFRYEAMQMRYRRCKEPVFDGWHEYGPDESGRVVLITKHPPAATEPEVPEGHTLEKRGKWNVIGVDRWFIEQWHGPKRAGGDYFEWEASRYKWLYDEDLGLSRKVDVHGPYPVQGRYAKSPYFYPWMIARHATDKSCCEEREKAGFVCLGGYRAPEQRDIDFIAYLIQEKDREAVKHEYDEAAPADVVRQDIRDYRTAEVEKEQKEKSELSYLENAIRNQLEKQPVIFDIRRSR